MERRTLPPEIQEKLNQEKWVIENGVFIKRYKTTSSVEVLYLIDENRDKLTADYFAYLTYIFVGKNDIIKGLGGKYYEDYQNFYNLYLDTNINKIQIIKKCIEAVLELRNIGLNYTDIHSKNIIVNKESHMRLVDLDEACIANVCNNNIVFRFIDLMLESMLFFDVKDTIWHWITPRDILIELENKKVLSSSFLDSVVEKDVLSSFYASADKYLLELSDVEKTSTLRKELKEKYPKWFIN